MPIDENDKVEDLISSDLPVICPRCHKGIDHDGDGNCGYCAKLTDVELAQLQEPEITSDSLITCKFDNCTELDIVNCRKCQRPFCIMHANRFSPNFCKECFSNLASIEDKFTRTFEDFDTKTDKLIISRETCTRYYMDGPDWPFLQLWIDTLDDNQLRAIWNFHFFVMKTIEAENEVRKIKKLKVLRETPTPKVQKTAKVVKGTVTKTTQVDTIDDLRKKFKKQGLPDAIIEQMIQAMGVK